MAGEKKKKKKKASIIYLNFLSSYQCKNQVTFF